MELGFQLETEMRQFEQDLKEWANQKVSSANNTRLQHMEAIKQHRETLVSLNAQKAALQETNTSKDKSNSALNEEIIRVEKEKARLEAELTTLSIEAKSAALALVQAQAEYQPQQNELEKEAGRLRNKQQDVERFVTSFQQNLGLAFERLDGGGLRVMFTLIDPAQLDRVFSFVVRVTEERYDVHSVSPALNASEVQGLLQKLNEIDSFGWFVQAMRRKFRRLV